MAFAALGSLAACLPTGHVDIPAQPRASDEPRASGDLTTLLPGAQLARSGGADADDGNRLGDTPAPADDYSRWDAQLASATTGMPHINDVARRVRYNGVYFEIDIEVNGQDGARTGIVRGVVPVTWNMVRAHTPLVTDAYYARVYTSRGRSNGLQVPNLGPEVILPEAFTPELTPVIFDHFEPSFISWNRNFDGWTQGMVENWMKTAAITVARAWTPQYVGGVAVASARASRITGQMALGAAAVPNAAAATRACSGGQCAAARWGPRHLGPGAPASVTRNGLSAAEAGFAQEIVNFRGGSFVGVARRSAAGIDGFIDGVPASLKSTQGGLGAVLRHASRAESSARNAGFSGVELFIRAPNVGRGQLLDFARSGPLEAIPNQGTISAINVFTRDGVVRIIGGGP